MTVECPDEQSGPDAPSNQRGDRKPPWNPRRGSRFRSPPADHGQGPEDEQERKDSQRLKGDVCVVRRHTEDADETGGQAGGYRKASPPAPPGTEHRRQSEPWQQSGNYHAGEG